jgi:hypothetical protein
MTAKEFISGVLIGEIKDVVDRHPFLAFALLAVGIEFLGRCLDNDPWDCPYDDEDTTPFDSAINELFPYSYHNAELRDRMRNGLLHFYRPKPGLLLSQVAEEGIQDLIPSRAHHPYFNTVGDSVTLVVEYLFADFADACREVCDRSFPVDHKMNATFLRTDVPPPP